jgi:hypothetical protein
MEKPRLLAGLFAAMSQRHKRAFRARLAEHFELFLAAAGVLALMVSLSELSKGDQGMALIFLIWLQGFLTWSVHRHCWFRRRALFLKLRAHAAGRPRGQCPSS